VYADISNGDNMYCCHIGRLKLKLKCENRRKKEESMTYITIETTGLSVDKGHEIILMNIDGKIFRRRAIGTPDARAMEFNGLDEKEGMEPAEFQEIVNAHLAEADLPIILHNKKFTISMCLNAGIEITQFIDLMQEAKTAKKPAALKKLAKLGNYEGTDKIEMLRSSYNYLCGL